MKIAKEGIQVATECFEDRKVCRRQETNLSPVLEHKHFVVHPKSSHFS